MDRQTIAVLAGAAEAIHASIATHNRAREAHRREARRLHAALDQIHKEAERLGIRIEITQAPPRRQSQ